MKFLAKVGDLVTCEAGHPIAHVLDNIEPYTPARVSQFGWLRSDHKPKPCDRFTGCPECGAAYVRRIPSAPHYVQLHTREQGWMHR